VVLTVDDPKFDNGDKIKILGVVGMTELNENVYKLAGKSGNTYQLQNAERGDNIDGTSFNAYESGGTAQKVTKDISGLEHLAGRKVTILADGCAMPKCEVDSEGKITVADYANKIHAGLPYIAKLKPMNLEAGANAGTAQGKIKKIDKVTVRLRNTMACKIGTCEEDLEEIDFRSDSDPADAPVPLFTGDKDIKAFPGDYSTSGDILIVNDAPLPMTVVAIMPELKTMDVI
jgi:hypothetical protein